MEHSRFLESVENGFQVALRSCGYPHPREPKSFMQRGVAYACTPAALPGTWALDDPNPNAVRVLRGQLPCMLIRE